MGTALLAACAYTATQLCTWYGITLKHAACGIFKSAVRDTDYTVTPSELTFSDCLTPCSETKTINFGGVTDGSLEDTETIVLEFNQLQDQPFQGYNSMTFTPQSNGDLVDGNGNCNNKVTMTIKV